MGKTGKAPHENLEVIAGKCLVLAVAFLRFRSLQEELFPLGVGVPISRHGPEKQEWIINMSTNGCKRGSESQAVPSAVGR